MHKKTNQVVMDYIFYNYPEGLIDGDDYITLRTKWMEEDNQYFIFSDFGENYYDYYL